MIFYLHNNAYIYIYILSNSVMVTYLILAQKNLGSNPSWTSQ